ncbi:hypothetical protein [Dyella telluris]|uniref:Uncharacterized protein n=1 Tax=Dyella telluris TaxID=2763498 RepID=A0A7G8Q2B3_9GAMM|nr:hypothetical protein [Dyella telluris]QNK00921.1 hypothetical protein H8F01_17870 [Dyella telluris]
MYGTDVAKASHVPAKGRGIVDAGNAHMRTVSHYFYACFFNRFTRVTMFVALMREVGEASALHIASRLHRSPWERHGCEAASSSAGA